MSDFKISELPAAESLTGDELTAVVQGGETKKSTVSGMLAGEAAARDAALAAETAARVAADSAEAATRAAADDELTSALDGKADLIGGKIPAAQLPVIPRARIAFVDADGDDTTGGIGDAARPFSTAQAAYAALLAVTPPPSVSAPVMLKLGVGAFTIALAADWMPHVIVSGAGAEVSKFFLNVSGISGITGAAGAAGASAVNPGDQGDAGGVGGNGTNGTGAFNVNLKSDCSVTISIAANGGAGGQGGIGGAGGNAVVDNSTYADGGAGGNGGGGGTGGNGGNVTLTRCVLGTVIASGGTGGSGGRGGSQGSDNYGYSYSGYYPGNGGTGGSGGMGGVLTLVECRGGTATADGGTGGQSGESGGYYGMGGNSGGGGGARAALVIDCASLTVSVTSGSDGYVYVNSAIGMGGSVGGLTGTMLLTRCKAVTATYAAGEEVAEYGGGPSAVNGGNIIAQSCVDCILTSAGSDAWQNYSYGATPGVPGAIQVLGCGKMTVIARWGQTPSNAYSTSYDTAFVIVRDSAEIAVTYDTNFSYGNYMNYVFTFALDLKVVNSTVVLSLSTMAASQTAINIAITLSGGTLRKGSVPAGLPAYYGQSYISASGAAIEASLMALLADGYQQVFDYDGTGNIIADNNTLATFGTAPSTNRIVPTALLT